MFTRVTFGLTSWGQILVARGDDDVGTGCNGLHGECSDHIVRLDAVDTQDRKTQRADESQHRLDLRDQFIRHGRSVRLIFREQLVAKSRTAGIDDEGNEIGFGLQRRAQHIDDTEQGARGLAGAIGQRRQGVKGAIKIAGTVDQNEFGTSHGTGTERGTASLGHRRKFATNRPPLASSQGGRNRIGKQLWYARDNHGGGS